MEEALEFIKEKLTIDGAPVRLNAWQKQLIERLLAGALSNEYSKPIVIVKSRQVGMTTIAGLIELAIPLAGLGPDEPAFKTLHAFPTLHMAAAYGKGKLTDLVLDAAPGSVRRRNGTFKSCVEERIGWGPSCNTMHCKVFDDGSVVRVDSCGANGDRIRGITNNLIIFDEAQEIKHDAISVVSRSLYGTKGQAIYLITPKDDKDKYFWDNSSKHYFNLNCEECKSYFPIYKVGKEYNWKDILIHGHIIKCPHCSHEQNRSEAISRGKWMGIHEDLPFIGFHINQLLCESFPRELIDNQKDRPYMDDNIFCREVLGDWPIINYD